MVILPLVSVHEGPHGVQIKIEKDAPSGQYRYEVDTPKGLIQGWSDTERQAFHVASMRVESRLGVSR